MGHSATLSFFGTPGDLNQTKVWSASYVAPIGTQGWSVEATGYQSNSNVASTGGTSVLGKGHALGVKSTTRCPTAASGGTAFLPASISRITRNA